MALKNKYCPDWIYDCVVAHVCRTFILYGVDLAVPSKKLALGLSSHYAELSTDELYRSSEAVIHFLVEAGVDENSIDVLSNFSYFRFYYLTKLKKRNFSGLLSWGLLSTSSRGYSGLTTLKHLKAFYYEQRSSLNEIGSPGWTLEAQSEVEFLRDIVKESKVFEQELGFDYS